MLLLICSDIHSNSNFNNNNNININNNRMTTLSQFLLTGAQPPQEQMIQMKSTKLLRRWRPWRRVCRQCPLPALHGFHPQVAVPLIAAPTPPPRDPRFWDNTDPVTIRKVSTQLLLPAATKLGQGNIFTGVCLSTGGGSASVHAGIYPLGPDTPQEQTPPLGADTPWTRPPLEQTPLEQTPSPPLRDPPGADIPQEQTPPPGNPPGPDNAPPPRKQTPAYGQRVAGTNPTGMHSCFLKINCCYYLAASMKQVHVW